jgi:type III restriction enzyme
MSYSTNDKGMFDPEYAEVYGVPFSFIPCSGTTEQPKPGPTPTHVRALDDRIGCEITFPRVDGYRYELPVERLTVKFSDASKLALSTLEIPTKVQLDPIVGESSIHTLDDLKVRREQEVVFLLSKLVLENYFKDDGGNEKPWLYPQLLGITRQWLSECVTLKDNTFPQLLLLIEFAHEAAAKIYQAIVGSNEGDKTIKPLLKPYDTIGSTRYVELDTTRPVFATRPDKCHISHVVADTASWEQKMASALEEMDEVISYVKNTNLGFSIPYILNNEEKNYYPDFIAKIKVSSPPVGKGRGLPPNDSIGGEGETVELNLIIEVTGEHKKDKVAKVSTAKTLWIPAINNHGGFGRWAFIEITDPWNAKNEIRSFIQS